MTVTRFVCPMCKSTDYSRPVSRTGRAVSFFFRCHGCDFAFTQPELFDGTADYGASAAGWLPGERKARPGRRALRTRAGAAHRDAPARRRLRGDAPARRRPHAVKS